MTSCTCHNQTTSAPITITTTHSPHSHSTDKASGSFSLIIEWLWSWNTHWWELVDSTSRTPLRPWSHRPALSLISSMGHTVEMTKPITMMTRMTRVMAPNGWLTICTVQREEGETSMAALQLYRTWHLSHGFTMFFLNISRRESLTIFLDPLIDYFISDSRWVENLPQCGLTFLVGCYTACLLYFEICLNAHSIEWMVSENDKYDWTEPTCD